MRKGEKPRKGKHEATALKVSQKEEPGRGSQKDPFDEVLEKTYRGGGR